MLQLSGELVAKCQHSGCFLGGNIIAGAGCHLSQTVETLLLLV
jgi:hypothetical protein